jgi:hypothetical protein
MVSAFKTGDNSCDQRVKTLSSSSAVTATINKS